MACALFVISMFNVENLSSRIQFQKIKIVCLSNEQELKALSLGSCVVNTPNADYLNCHLYKGLNLFSRRDQVLIPLNN